jgi:DNA-binding PucR family transcriptional regulator
MRESEAMLFAADNKGSSWATADRVAAHRLLLATAGADLRQRLQDHLLGPIVEYDRRHSADLLKTLVAYFANDCSWKATADILHVHVNTLRYRIQKVQELMQRDLRRTDDRLDVLLALQSREFDKSATGS